MDPLNDKLHSPARKRKILQKPKLEKKKKKDVTWQELFIGINVVKY